MDQTAAMDFVEQLKSSVDIVQVIQEYVRLRKAGANRYTGLCPFHNEKTPSFSVNTLHQFYKCFGCGAGGDVLKFVMEIERLSFYEALKLLAERNGIPMPKRSEYSDPETKLRAALYQMHELAEQAFRAQSRRRGGRRGARLPGTPRRGAGDGGRVRPGIRRALRARPGPAVREARLHRRADGEVRPGGASATTAASTTASAIA